MDRRQFENRSVMRVLKYWRNLSAVLCLSACVTAPSQRDPLATDTVASIAADIAYSMVGKPYKYGGSKPSGFDCSGLVQYSYRKTGIKLPRATGAQLSATLAIRLRDLRRGDLLFFDEEGEKNSHVAIYLGDGVFVHSPSTGGTVRVEKLDSAHWKKTFSAARRI
jgi:cell wall-associated NlpC family hydrolase